MSCVPVFSVSMTVPVALDAVGWDEVDWAVEAGVDSPPQAASANERTTTTERAIQRNVERPPGRNRCGTIETLSFYERESTELFLTSPLPIPHGLRQTRQSM